MSVAMAGEVRVRFIPDPGDPQTRVFVEYTLRRRDGGR